MAGLEDPLTLGSYYVEEISRSEGYRAFQNGERSFREQPHGIPVVITESGECPYGRIFPWEINEWDGKSYDFTVDYLRPKGLTWSFPGSGGFQGI